MPQREINLEPTARPAPGPAAGWADAYREILETLWADVSADPDDLTDVHQAPEVAALVAFAAEIRKGITAGLITATPVVRVPLLGATRIEHPRADVTGNGDADLAHAAAHLPVLNPDHERIRRGGYNPREEATGTYDL